MKINPIQFNFVQARPQNTVNRSLYMNNELQADTFSFTGANKKDKKPKTLDDLVPKYKGIIYKKVRDKDGNIVKIPQEVNIVNRSCGTFDFDVDGNLVGYARLSYLPKEYCEKDSEFYDGYLSKNYEDLGIVGDRIEVDFVENEKEKKYGGVGHLADLIEVACCKELGFKPNVVSVSLADAAPMHYKRGKRFVPYERYFSESELKDYNLKGKDPNETVREIIESTPKGKKFNTSELKTDPLMYMPKEMIKELEKELKEHPIF